MVCKSNLLEFLSLNHSKLGNFFLIKKIISCLPCFKIFIEYIFAFDTPVCIQIKLKLGKWNSLIEPILLKSKEENGNLFAVFSCSLLAKMNPDTPCLKNMRSNGATVIPPLFFSPFQCVKRTW